MGASILGIVAFLFVGYSMASVRIITQGNAALVERLGRYNRKLTPGLNFIIPIVDQIVLKRSLREQILDIEPQMVITHDNVRVEIDAIMYWRILDLERTYYAIENIEQAIVEIVTNTLRSELATIELENIFASRDAINRALIERLDEATNTWGIKVMRVELQDIQAPSNLLKTKSATMAKRALITTSEGEREASVIRAKGTVEYMNQLANAFQKHGDSKAILHYLLTSQYIEATQKLGESRNSTIVFMDPRTQSEDD